MFGVLAMMSASAFTTVMASESIPSADEQWRIHFLARIKILQTSFYLLSLVLVTSTATILLFTSLPLELMADGTSKNISIKHALDHQKGLIKTSSDLGAWLHEFVFVSIKKQAMNVLMMTVPMLAGPLDSLLQQLSSMTV